ncbi:hypothetical protein MY4038_008376 [Beauveria bassiana]
MQPLLPKGWDAAEARRRLLTTTPSYTLHNTCFFLLVGPANLDGNALVRLQGPNLFVSPLQTATYCLPL